MNSTHYNPVFVYRIKPILYDVFLAYVLPLGPGQKTQGSFAMVKPSSSFWTDFFCMTIQF